MTLALEKNMGSQFFRISTCQTTCLASEEINPTLPHCNVETTFTRHRTYKILVESAFVTNMLKTKLGRFCSRVVKGNDELGA